MTPLRACFRVRMSLLRRLQQRLDWISRVSLMRRFLSLGSGGQQKGPGTPSLPAEKNSSLKEQPYASNGRSGREEKAGSAVSSSDGRRKQQAHESFPSFEYPYSDSSEEEDDEDESKGYRRGRGSVRRAAQDRRSQEEEGESTQELEGDEEVDLAFFDGHSTAARLLVHDCHLGASTAERLGRALEHNPNVQQVALEKVSLPPSSLRSLVSGLVGNREGAVRELCLEDSWLTDQHVRAVVETIRFCRKPARPFALQALSLRGNQASDESMEGVALLLRPPLSTWLRLTRLSLEHNRIGDGGAALLALALADGDTLTDLNLGHNRIGPRGASRLAEAVLRSGSRVASLHLHSNRVGAMGAAAIAKALVQASSCEEGGGPMGGGGSLALLDLRNNNLGDAGAAELVRAVDETTSMLEAGGKGGLKRLLLGGNGVNICGCQACRDDRVLGGDKESEEEAAKRRQQPGHRAIVSFD